MTKQINFTRVNNDTNGNPRYVCHFLTFITKKDKCTTLDESYALALKRSRVLGGRKFHNQQYGDGIVFQSYNLPTFEQQIIELTSKL